MNIELIGSVIESIDLPDQNVTNREHINEFLTGCDKKTYEKIREHVLSLRESSNIKPQKIKCIHCQHEYSQDIVINQTDFFG